MVIACASSRPRDLKRKIKPALTAAQHTAPAPSCGRRNEAAKRRCEDNDGGEVVARCRPEDVAAKKKATAS